MELSSHPEHRCYLITRTVRQLVYTDLPQYRTVCREHSYHIVLYCAVLMSSPEHHQCSETDRDRVQARRSHK